MFTSSFSFSNSTTGQTLNVLAPCEVTFALSSLNLSQSPYKFVIDYGNGKFDEKVINLETLTPLTQQIFTTTYTFKPEEYPTFNTKSFAVTLCAFCVNISEPIVYQNFLNINIPILANTLNSMFSAIRLAKTYSYGTDNNTVYIFESISPKLYIPILIQWGNTHNQEQAPTKERYINLPLQKRPVNILPPYFK